MNGAARIVLITGCSSGIGAALAQEFHARGHKVIATARKLEALQAHAQQGMVTVELDVNSPDSIARAVASVQASHGRVDILVNNAGYGQFGAMMDLSADDLRAQFETNVVSPVMVTQAFLPLLRKSSGGCVAHVSSISGIVTTPFAGAYCASKAAVNAIGDAMRMELAPLGVRVMTIQPGGIASNFGNAGHEKVRLPAGSLYQPIAKSIERRALLSQVGATPANAFARKVVDDLLADRPPAISRHGAQSTRLPWLKRLLPLRTLDRKMQALFGLDRLRR